MTYQTIKTPAGETLVVLPLADFELLLDGRDAALHGKTMEAEARGEIEWLTPEVTLEFVAATTPLAFWRAKRALTQTALATQAGISQSYLASLEAGKRKGDPALFKRLARVLRVSMDDLVGEA